MKLIPLIDYVLSKENTESEYTNDISAIRDYASFLAMETELSMFLPVKYSSVNDQYIILNIGDDGYEEALEKVIFSDVTYTEIRDCKYYSVGDTQIFNLSLDGKHLYWHCNTIDELANSFDDNIQIKYK